MSERAPDDAADGSPPEPPGGGGAGREGGDAGDEPDRHRADETLGSESLPDSVRCPHCGEEESEQFASFGSAVSVSQYYCRSCRTVFEAFKWR